MAYSLRSNTKPSQRARDLMDTPNSLKWDRNSEHMYSVETYINRCCYGNRLDNYKQRWARQQTKLALKATEEAIRYLSEQGSRANFNHWLQSQSHPLIVQGYKRVMIRGIKYWYQPKTAGVPVPCYYRSDDESETELMPDKFHGFWDNIGKKFHFEA